ncbi:hypothetical protein Poli38472_004908 [Pythium oligandrum]|uniref:Uncharacterized protein n=1 Tax=Pythium oligandrum TaxID=41045 RepID=A0A8K1CB68_PYTOL|nr:hypothetical protein Poli38472_004908 [Pythium oligandrum]|eukprot:TMW59839.1 hypothetical protein Poli38472_004908 [Pythium oligandrum]
MELLELDDDPATLQAALALIDAMDESSSNSGVTSEEDRSVASDAQEPVEEPTRFTSRKHEIDFLHRKVKTLEDKLSTLKRRREDTEDATQSLKEVADRQEEHRQFVELENARLRAVLGTQMTVSKELIHSLQREEAGGLAHLKRPKLSIPVAQGLLRDAHLLRIDELHRRSDEAFSASQFHSKERVFREIELSEDGVGGATIEIMVGWTLPFASDQVFESLWRATRQQGVKQGKATQDDNDQVAVVYESRTMEIEQLVSGEMFSKRFDAQDDMPPTIVSHSSAKIIKTLTCCIQDIEYSEDSWIRVVPTTQSSESATSQTTQVYMSRRVHLAIATDDSVFLRRKAGTLTDFVLGWIDNELTWRQRAIENLLVSSKS